METSSQRKKVSISASGFTFVIKEFSNNDDVIACDCNDNDSDDFVIIVVVRLFLI